MQQPLELLNTLLFENHLKLRMVPGLYRKIEDGALLIEPSSYVVEYMPGYPVAEAVKETDETPKSA